MRQAVVGRCDFAWVESSAACARKKTDTVCGFRLFSPEKLLSFFSTTEETSFFPGKQQQRSL